MALDLSRAHLIERRRPPTRLVVLVDDHGAHAFIEIVALDETRHYAEFGAHARGEIPTFAAPHLRQRELEAERRFGTHGSGGFLRPAAAVAIERGENGLNRSEEHTSELQSRLHLVCRLL